MKSKFTLIIILFQTLASAQVKPVDELENTYWSYRHKLKTEFLKIGSEPGHSLPAYQRDYSKKCGDTYGTISFGDGVIDLGEYIATLASEYKLLKQSNQDLTATTNELYYALKAIGRLDGFAEIFFTLDPLQAAYNGFFSRSDVPSDMYRIINHNEAAADGSVLTLQDYQPLNIGLNFQHSPNTAGPIPANNPDAEGGAVKATNFLYGGTTDYIVTAVNDCYFKRFNDGRDIDHMVDNEMSQDQVYGIILGLYSVYKLVPADVGAQPNAEDGDDYINFHSYVKYLTDEIVSYCAKMKTVKNAYVPINDNLDHKWWHRVSEMRTTWFITNKNNNDRQVWRGSNLWAFAYPMSQIAHEMTGKIYHANVLIEFPKLIDQLKLVGASIAIPIVSTAGGTVLGGAIGSRIPLVGIPVGATVGAGGGFVAGVSAVLGTIMITQQLAYDPQMIWYNVQQVPILRPNEHLANQMILKVAAMNPNNSNLRFQNMINAVPNSEPFALIRHSLHPTKYNLPSNIGTSYWHSRLSEAYCYGAGKTALNLNTTPTYWKIGEVLSLTAVAKPESEVNNTERVGLGYMLMHNLWRLADDNQTDVFKEELCFCYSTALVRNHNSSILHSWDAKPKVSEISSIEITPRKFSDYADIEIPKSFYLTHDVAIKSNGLLRVAGDLTVCGAQLTVEYGGEVFIPNTDPNYPTEMIVDNGGILNMQSIARLRIDDNSTLRIGSAGKLVIDKNVLIILDGPNANLIIEGTLEIKGNATFRILGGPKGLGYVTFKKHKNAVNGNETFAEIIGAGPNARIDIVGTSSTQRVLKIDGNFGVIVPESISRFKVTNGKIELGELSRLHVACPVTLDNCRINTINEVNDYYYYAGLITAGQSNVLVKNCVFRQGLMGVLAENYFYPHSKPVIDGCRFEDMIIAIRVDGGGLDLKNTSASVNSWNLVALGINTDCVFEEVYFGQSKTNLFSGSSSGVLNWYQGGISNNYESGLLVVGTTFKPKCLSIRNNAGHGLQTRGGSYVSLSARLDAGYNYFTSNDKAGIYDRTFEGDLFGAGKGLGVGIELLDGFNSFKDNGTYAIDAVINPGSITVSMGAYTLESSKNYWGTSTAPVNQTDYKTYLKHNWGSPLMYPDIATNGNHLFSEYQHLSGQFGTCLQGELMVPDSFSGGHIIDCTDAFDGGVLDGQPVVVAWEEGKTYLFKDNNPELAMVNFTELLLHDFDCPQSNDPQYIMYTSYKNYMMGYAKLLGDVDSLEIPKTPLIDNTIGLLNTLLIKAEDSTTGWNSYNFMLEVDLADCYRAKDDRLTALSMYDDMLLKSEYASQYDLIEYYKCIAEGEHRVLNGEISIYDKLEQYACQPPIEGYDEIINTGIIDTRAGATDSTGIAIATDFQILLHPNPTNGSFTVSFNDEILNQFVGELATLEVADGYGITHIDLNNVDINTPIVLNLSGYQAGVYHIRCVINGNLFTKYLILTDQ